MNEIILVKNSDFNGNVGRFMYGSKTTYQTIEFPIPVSLNNKHYIIQKRNVYSIFLRKPEQQELIFWNTERGIRVINLALHPEWNTVFKLLASQISLDAE